jgi:hypothetical protein
MRETTEQLQQSSIYLEIFWRYPDNVRESCANLKQARGQYEGIRL